MFSSSLLNWPLRPRWISGFRSAAQGMNPSRAGGRRPPTIVENPPLGGGGPTGVFLGGEVSPQRRTGILIVDVNDVHARIAPYLAEQLRPPLTPVKWRAVRHHVRSEMGITRSFSVVRFDASNWTRRERLRRHMMQRGYRHREPLRPKFGFHSGDPAKDWIGWRLESLVDSWGPKLPAVCLVSHDGIFAEPLARLLALGVRIGIVGLIDQLSPELYGLTGPDALSDAGRVRLFDLELDIHAIELSQRWQAPETIVLDRADRRVKQDQSINIQ